MKYFHIILQPWDDTELWVGQLSSKGESIEAPRKVRPTHWCSDEGLMLETSANTLYGVQHIHNINLTLIHCMLQLLGVLI